METLPQGCSIHMVEFELGIVQWALMFASVHTSLRCEVVLSLSVLFHCTCGNVPTTCLYKTKLSFCHANFSSNVNIALSLRIFISIFIFLAGLA